MYQKFPSRPQVVEQSLHKLQIAEFSGKIKIKIFIFSGNTTMLEKHVKKVTLALSYEDLKWLVTQISEIAELEESVFGYIENLL